MAATPVYTENLEVLLEADRASDPNNDPTYIFYDHSGNGRDFTNTGSPYPLAKHNAVPVSNKKSVVYDGTKKPHLYTGNLKMRCGYMVVKTTPTPASYGGLLTDAATFDFLVTDLGTNNFYDLGNTWFEYRLNNRITNRARTWTNGNETVTLTAPAPAGAFGIIFFRFWSGEGTLTSLQLGQQRGLTGARFNGEIALMAIYSEPHCEEKIWKMHQMLSFHYKIAIADKFPFEGSRGDTVRDPREVLTDGQKEPHLRIRDARSYRDFEASFGTRNIRELQQARAFHNSFYPDKTFIFRNYNTLPPEDTNVRFAIPTDMDRAESLNMSNYQLNFVESLGTLNYTIPAAAPVLD